ncbi:MAG TPA: SPOR domain-containing protein [Spirochaetia bacterium]|nr:SPOR domain-containing protein [Spirochaetia bacterium]
MEKQKIFWVVLAVSILVVIVLITGVFLLRQRPAGAIASSPGTINPISEPGTQIYEYQREVPSAAQQSGSGQQVQHFYIGEGAPGSGGAASGAASGTASGTTAQGTGSPAGASAGSAPGSATPPSTGQPGVTGAGGNPAVSATVTPAANPPARPKQVATPKPGGPKPSVKPALTQRVLEYWIQTGSYKSQSKAEELSGTLSDKGLTARVFSYASKGDTYYRVRIGPYGSSGEAQKFLVIVKGVQGLESSFVSQVHASRTLN